MDLDLTNPLGTDVTWDPTQIKTAQLVRRQAFIVVPSGARNELRFYQSFEPMPVLGDPSQYIVINDEVSTVTLPEWHAAGCHSVLHRHHGRRQACQSQSADASEGLCQFAGRQAGEFFQYLRADGRHFAFPAASEELTSLWKRTNPSTSSYLDLPE